LINYMALLGVHIQVATVIGGRIRMARRKDMEHTGGLLERDTRGNGSRIRFTGMEYTDGQMEECIMENKNRIREMVMGILGFHLAMNTTESSRMISHRERESRKRVTNYSESTMTKKASLSAKLNSMLHLQNDLSKY
jgi:hypothetical protein